MGLDLQGLHFDEFRVRDRTLNTELRMNTEVVRWVTDRVSTVGFSRPP